MADTNDKIEIKTCSKFDTSSCTSSNDKKDMPYDVLLQNCHMISLQCKNFKEKFKAFVYENIELKKSNEDLKMIQTLEDHFVKRMVFPQLLFTNNTSTKWG